MSNKILALVAALFLVVTGAANAQTVLFTDNFDSYSTDTAELTSSGPWYQIGGAWAFSSGIANGGSGQSLLEAGGNSATQLYGQFADTTPTVSLPLSIQTYTYGTPSTATLFRSGLTIMDYTDPGTKTGLNDLLASGWYHSTSTSNFGVRSLGGGGWQDSGTALVHDGWVQMTMVLDGTNVVFGFDGSDALTDTHASVSGFDTIRLGSFLGFGTANNLDIYYDDVVVETVVSSGVDDWHILE